MKKHFKQYWDSYFIGIIQIIFILLKLNEIINWKWVYVLMPLWIFLGILFTILILALIESGNRDRWN